MCIPTATRCLSCNISLQSCCEERVRRVVRTVRRCYLSCIEVQDRDTRYDPITETPRVIMTILHALHSLHRSQTAPPPTLTPSSVPPTSLQTSVPPTALEIPHSPPPAPLCSTPLPTPQPSQTDAGRASAGSCGKGLSTDDSAYASQEESSVASTHTVTRSSRLPPAGRRENGQPATMAQEPAPSQPAPQPSVSASSTPALASSQSPHGDMGRRSEGRPFQVVLQQRVSGVGLLLGSVSGAVAIKFMVSFGSAAKEGTLR